TGSSGPGISSSLTCGSCAAVSSALSPGGSRSSCGSIPPFRLGSSIEPGLRCQSLMGLPSLHGRCHARPTGDALEHERRREAHEAVELPEGPAGVEEREEGIHLELAAE